MSAKNSSKIIAQYFGPVLFRNAFSLITLIIATVIMLLFAFAQIQEGLFMSTVLFLNVVIGTIQDLRAKLALEKLQALMIVKAKRLTSAGEEEIDIDQVKVDDKLKIKLGDQIPADSVVVKTSGLEVNEALLTGESNNIVKKPGDKLFAGSFVVAGSAVIMVQVAPANSFVSEMTKKIKRYHLSLSPMQRATATFIKYMTYLLLLVAFLVILRGVITDNQLVAIIEEVAALTGTLVPEGLVLAMTVLFAYGAVKMFQSQVLLQEINAAEKLGQIKNLCIDKTGTLTENQPTVEQVIVYDNHSRQEADILVSAYLKANDDNSQTINALKKFVPAEFRGEISQTLPFSSDRKYGAVSLKFNNQAKISILGAPDILIDNLKSAEEKRWLKALVDEYSRQAKRLLLLGQLASKSDSDFSLNGLKVVAVYILANPLKAGTKDIVKFFQARGVKIRVISGDNPQTVAAIARQAGIENAERVITGLEMESWDKKDYLKNVDQYSLFARVKPEQKEKIIKAFRQYGFTAMVGDGANDALAIKKADLGIAMFDGAPATRQIAEIVLMNNSFSALPRGVALADSIIVTIEMVASIFFNKVVAGLGLFIILGLFSYTYPITPRNMTLINYLTIGLPILYWSLFPAQKVRTVQGESFLKKVLPYSILNGALTAVAAFIAFEISLESFDAFGSNVMVVLVFIVMGFWFFVNVPSSFGIKITPRQKDFLSLAGLAVILVLTTVFYFRPIANFFDLDQPPVLTLAKVMLVVLVFGWFQFFLPRKVFNQNIFKRL